MTKCQTTAKYQIEKDKRTDLSSCFRICQLEFGNCLGLLCWCPDITTIRSQVSLEARPRTPPETTKTQRKIFGIGVVVQHLVPLPAAGTLVTCHEVMPLAVVTFFGLTSSHCVPSWQSVHIAPCQASSMPAGGCLNGTPARVTPVSGPVPCHKIWWQVWQSFGITSPLDALWFPS